MKDHKEINVDEKLDTEWVELMLMARDLGISMEEIKIFLAQASIPQKY